MLESLDLAQAEFVHQSVRRYCLEALQSEGTPQIIRALAILIYFGVKHSIRILTPV